MKKFLSYLLVFVIGAVLSSLLTTQKWNKVADQKFAQINETRIVTEAGWLEQLASGDAASVKTSINHHLDRLLSSLYHFSEGPVAAPGEPVKEAIRKLQTLRKTMTENGAPYQPDKDQAATVEKAYSLAHKQ